MQNLALQLKEEIIGVVYASTTRTDLVESYVIDLGRLWRVPEKRLISSSCCSLNRLSTHTYTSPSAWRLRMLFRSPASHAFGYRRILEVEPMRPIYEHSPTKGMFLCAARDFSSLCADNIECPIAPSARSMIPMTLRITSF